MFRFAALLFAAFLSCIASAGQKLLADIDYGRADEWVILGTNTAAKTSGFDVFYIYPTLTNDPDRPLMDRTDPTVAAKTRSFATAQTKPLAEAGARIFAPFVRQASYGAAISALLNPGDPSAERVLANGKRDTLVAFRTYLQRWNDGRPFVLLGHSQGAMDLFALLRDEPSITPENGFVAAYLPGLPHLTPETFREALGTRFPFATSPHGVGVVATWHTQSEDCEENPYFTTPNGLCVNPLTWTTNATPAPASLNRFAELYDYRNPGKAANRYPAFCGATLLPERGAIAVPLPSDSQWDARCFMGRGCFHMNDIWFFAGNIASNAVERVREWRSAHP